MDILNRYLTYISDKSQETQKNYERVIRGFLNYLKERGVDHLGYGLKDGQGMESIIIDYITGLSRETKAGRKRLSPASQRTYLSTISSFYTWLIDIEKSTKENPAAVVLRTRKGLHPSPIGNNLQESEFQSVLESFTVPFKRSVKYQDIMRQRDHCIIHLLGSTGIRRIELHRLDVRAYDRDRQTIRVLGKGDKPRTVPVLDLAATILCTYIEKIRPAFPTPVKGHEYAMFLRPIHNKETGKDYSIRMSLSNITDRVGDLLKRAGVSRGLGPHTLRRSYGTWLLEDTGGNMRLVQEILGHADMSTTQRYTALSNKAADDLVRRAFRERSALDG